MKKNIFTFALCATFALGLTLTSCRDRENGDAKTELEKRTEYLMATKGWKLESATSSPDYQLSSGAAIANLISGNYFETCELDDIIYFREGSQVLDPGRDKKTVVYTDEEDDFSCKEPSTKEIPLGKWDLVKENALKYFFSPVSDKRLDTEVLTLNENTLTLRFSFVNVDAKAYTFTLTYTKQK